jgi:DNA-binding MarR family transcriptional regulator
MTQTRDEAEQEALRAALEQCACANVKRLARVVSGIYDDALRPHGLTSGQFVLLVAIRTEGPAPIKTLASHLGVERTVMSRNLRPLMKEGWVTMTANNADRRYRTIELTETGLSKVRAALPAWRGAQERVRAPLGEVGFEAMLGEFRRLDRLLGAA